MKYLANAIFLTVLMSIFSSARITANDTSSSRLTGFISAGVGNFNISFPDVGPAGQAVGENVGWNDVYGSKGGISLGGEGGLGISDLGLFGVIRYKRWEKTGNPELFGSGSFDGDLTWTQEFLSIGARYFFVSQIKNTSSFLPYVGGGFARSIATEKMVGTFSSFGSDFDVDLQSDLDGNGLYVEGGADFYLSPSVSLRGLIEYSSINLGTTVSGLRYEIDGGGGFYAAAMVNFFFGKSLK